MEYYLCVLDFEATCWNNSEHKNQMEIIEWPSVLYKVTENENGSIATTQLIGEFQQYVKPTINYFSLSVGTGGTYTDNLYVEYGASSSNFVFKYCLNFSGVKLNSSINFLTCSLVVFSINFLLFSIKFLKWVISLFINIIVFRTFVFFVIWDAKTLNLGLFLSLHNI